MAGVLIATLAGVGCESGVAKVDPIDVTPDPEIPCDFDGNDALDAAVDLNAVSGELVSQTLCPRGDIDAYRIAGLAAGSLVEVELVYKKLSQVRFLLQWHGPKGSCAGNVSKSCESNADCDGGSACTMSRQRLAQVLEAPVSGTEHVVKASFSAPVQGDYYLLVEDNNQQEQDGAKTYSLKAQVFVEPDAQEPNGTPAAATEVVSDQVLTGYVATASDVDFFVVPAASSPQILDVQLSYAAGSTVPVVYELISGDVRVDAPAVRVEGSERVMRNTLVFAPGEPIYIVVSPTVAAASRVDAYRLQVSISGDADEGDNRDDQPNASRVLAMGAPADATVHTQQHTLTAENDVDWYFLQFSNVAANSLLLARVSAPQDADYLLRATFYKQTAAACSAGAQCPSTLCDSQRGKCLAPWVYRPSLKGPGDPQEGGLSPNYLETQLPIFSGDDLYVEVRHITGTTADLSGFDATLPYEVQFEHKIEPEAFDRAASESEFIPEPVGKTESVFEQARRPRNITADCTGCGTSGRKGFASVVPGAYAVLSTTGPTCVPLPMEAFDDAGNRRTSGISVSFAMNPDVGAFVQDCTTQNVGTQFSVSGNTTLGLLIDAGVAAQEIVITTSGSRLHSAESVFALSAQNLQSLGLTVGTSRSLATGVPSPATAATLATNFGLTAQGGADITLLVGDAAYAECGACQNIASSQSLHLKSSGTGWRGMTIRAPGFAPATVGFAVHEAAVVSTSSGTLNIEGYLSYDGDQDWYVVDVGDMPAGYAKLEVDFAASPIDLRVLVKRGDAATGFGRTSDACDCGSGSCDSLRNNCNQDAFVDVIGFGNECTFLPSNADKVYIWVNDTFSNDWDVGNSYKLRLQIVEGCPDACDTLSCTR